MIVFPMRRDRVFMFPAAMFRTPQRPTHGGIDLTPIVQGAAEEFYAPEAGRVVIADDYTKTDAGKNVMVLSATGRRWWLGHASRLDVILGQQVRAGQRIALIGDTGNTDGVHAHLELHAPAINVERDPWPLLRDAPDPTGSTAPLATSREKATATAKGLFMALTDKEQADLKQKVDALYDSLAKPGERGWTFRDIIESHVKATLAEVRGGDQVDANALADELSRRLQE